MMRRITSVTIVAGLVLAGLTSQPVQAHVLETDNGVSAVLHMPPDDVPPVGKAVAADLAFASANPNFDVNDYRIEARLLRGETTVQTAVVQPVDSSGRGASAILTFPERGAYRLAVQGSARDPQHQPRSFKLLFSVRAVQAGDSEPGAWQAAGSDFWLLSVGSLAVLGLIARYNIVRGKRYL